MLIQEKKHRLPPESYKGRVEVAFTACTKERISAFVEARLVGKCVEILLQECANRDEQEVQKQIRYIIENPVRKGLVTRWKDYRFKGSTVLISMNGRDAV